MPTLLERIADGDQSAVVECVDSYGGMVWRMARRYLDRADTDVDDAVQEVFIALWMKASRYDPARGSEAAFVASLARNRLTDYQRRIVSRRRHLKGFATQQLPGAAARSQHGAQHGPAHERGESVATANRAFHELPEEERRALWLAVQQGLTHQQISEVTDAPLGTVKSRLRRAAIRLCEATARVTGRVGAES